MVNIFASIIYKKLLLSKELLKKTLEPSWPLIEGTSPFSWHKMKARVNLNNFYQHVLTKYLTLDDCPRKHGN